MFIKKWEEIPESLKNEKTYEYYQRLKRKKISLFIKRIFDIIYSILLLIVMSPILIILAICIKLESEGPVFYRQERVTQYGKIFKIYKFRTMALNADKKGSSITLSDDPRITKVGRLIRKCRMDEVPQLINILIGDMSFVGTRPEIKKYVDKYTDEMKATLLMKAGVTSQASIKFKDEDTILEKYLQKSKEKVLIQVNADYEEGIDMIKIIDKAYEEEILPQKMKYNLDYIKEFNIMKDIKLMFNTVGILLNKKNK